MNMSRKLEYNKKEHSNILALDVVEKFLNEPKV